MSDRNGWKTDSLSGPVAMGATSSVKSSSAAAADPSSATRTPPTSSDTVPLLGHPATSAASRTNSVTAGPRRRSKLTSGGRWDWAYEPEAATVAKMYNDENTFGIKFHVFKRSGIFQRKRERWISVSVPERMIRFAGPRSAIYFPTTSVSRLTPSREKLLEVRAAPQMGNHRGLPFVNSKHKSWIRTLEFDTAANRDEFLKIVRGLNAVGGTVSSMFSRVEHLVTSEKLIRALLSVESDPVYEPPTPRSPVDETSFFRWFLLVSEDRDPNMLLRGLEEAIIAESTARSTTANAAASVTTAPGRKTGAYGSAGAMSVTNNSNSGGNEERGSGAGTGSPFTTTSKRPQANSLSKRGPLFCEPKLFAGEIVLSVEDTVTLVHRLDSKEVRHVIGELVLTNYRLAFSVYESELTARPSMTAMSGAMGVAKYITDFDSANNNNNTGGGGGADDSITSDSAGIAGSIRPERVSTSAGTTITVTSCPTGGMFGKDLKASVPSLRFGRRPDTVFVAVTIPLASVCKSECKHSNLFVETTLGRMYTFQFDRADDFLGAFVDRVAEARQKSFFSQLLQLEESSSAVGPIYDARAELYRQLQGPGPASSVRFGFFENTGYDLCSTYPSLLVEPQEFTKRTGKMDAVARFRSRARVPAVTWAHRNTDCVLARSSQPLTGLKQAKCVEDEELLGLLSSGKRMFVVDARGPAAVAGNQLVRGKGAELPSRYPEVTFLFMGIGNIHTMRSSYERLAIACAPGSFDSERFLQKVEESKWLSHLRLILDGSSRVAELMELEESSVLIHCSDGWDRTAQMCSLAQIILDPYYRTIRGMAVLVEKDWVAFGFKFKDRCTGTDEDEKSPIWIQFVDCVYQFRRQFPRHFEFNEDFLTMLAEAPYSGRFATFGFNAESERTEACRRCKSRAWEFWTEVLARQDQYRNPSFEPYTYGPLWPHTSTKRIVLWEGLHLKGDAGAPPLGL